MTSEHGENEEMFTLLSEAALALFAETAENVEFIVENKYNENFEKDLIECCQHFSDKMPNVQ